MRMSSSRLNILRIGALLLVACNAQPPACWAITVNQVDTFDTGTTQGWGYNNPTVPAGIVMNGGASGAVGDHALLVDTVALGIQRLLVHNRAQWVGNWTAAGIMRVSMDVKNPNEFTLSMRLGIAGPDFAQPGGDGDVFVTKTVSPVPADNAWHSITFDVLAGDFKFVNDSYQNAAAALANVTLFRILHVRQFGDYSGNGEVDAADYVVWRNTVNSVVPIGTGADGYGPEAEADGIVDGFDYDFWKSLFGDSVVDFRGAQVTGKFQLDNIRAPPALPAGAGSMTVVGSIPEPASRLFMTGLFVFAWVSIRRRV
jgi:hypothetical protein